MNILSHPNPIYRSLAAVLVLAFAVSACTPAAPPEATEPAQEAAEATAAPTDTAVPTEPPTATFTPEPTATPLPTETPTPEPTPFAGSSGPILFEVADRTTSQIYSINPDGSNLQQLTEGDTFKRQWAVSPDGQQVLFTQMTQGDNPTDVWLMNIDGSDARQITDNPVASSLSGYSFGWSPDGEVIYTAHSVFDFGTNSTGFLFYETYDSDGNFLEESPFFPVVWSPDGQQVIGYSDVDGNREVYIMDADGSNVRNLSNNPGKDELFTLYGPAWSQDGSSILLSSEQGGIAQVYRLDIASGDTVNISQTQARVRSWAWSPDGNWIYYVTDSGGNFNIWRADANGENRSQITEMAGHEVRYFLSPDGSRMIFENYRTNQYFSYIAAPDGTEPAPLLNDPALIGNVYGYSPDGQWFLAMLDVDGQKVVYIISADGTDVRPLIQGVFDPVLVLNGFDWVP